MNENDGEKTFKFGRPNLSSVDGEGGDSAKVTDLNSAKPFLKTAREYLSKGWSPMPLPEKEKFPPPTGYTGYAGKVVDSEDVMNWFADISLNRANVGLHLTDVSIEGVPEGYTIVGVDVDAYDGKVGEESLEWLTEQLGPLPDTWTSSSRNDGVSGIRFYLAPADLKYMGLLRKSVDFIQAGHRYAVVYPSLHPGGGRYGWYNPGRTPQGEPDNEIPVVADLPLLPDPWVDHATKGRRKLEDFAIDKDSTPDELYDWMNDTFQQEGGERYSYLGRGNLEDLALEEEEALKELEEIGCGLLRRKVADFINEAGLSEDSHDVLIRAHWYFVNSGKEGHHGWMAAMRAFEAHWKRHVFGDPEADPLGLTVGGKRGMEEAVMEIFRSRTEAIRKVKSKIELDLETGLNTIASDCPCVDEPEGGWNEGIIDSSDPFDVSGHRAKDPGDYAMNDDGNGEHFVDLFGGDFMYVGTEKKWIFWDKNARCWHWDQRGMTRRAWRVVKRRQERYLDVLKQQYFQAKAMESPETDALKAKYFEARDWVRSSGNNGRATAALEAAESWDPVALVGHEIDSDPRLLGVANGIVELREDGLYLRQAEKGDLVVSNTNVPFVDVRELAGAPNGSDGGMHLWLEYLNVFVPDLEIRMWLQQIVGYCLFGKNSMKKIIFLYGTSNTGKSTFLEAIMSAIGEYASSASMDIFSGEERNPQLMDVVFKRIITLSEADTKKDISVDVIKQFVGQDEVVARRLNSNDILRAVPAFTPIIATNAPPALDKSDVAFENRLEVIPFNHVVEANEKGEDIRELCKEAILSWAMQGWEIFCQYKLGNRPDNHEMRKARQDFLNDMTPLGNFFAEYLDVTVDEDSYETVGDVYQAYLRYCTDYRIDKPWSKNTFGRQMRNAGRPSDEKAKKIDGKASKIYRRVRILDRPTATVRIMKN